MLVLLRGQLKALSGERLQLMASARAERARLRAALAPADELAARAARLRERLRSIQGTPLYLGLAAAALVLLRLKPVVLGTWLARGLVAWRFYQEMRRRRLLT
jgi:hypothetical protein